MLSKENIKRKKKKRKEQEALSIQQLVFHGQSNENQNVIFHVPKERNPLVFNLLTVVSGNFSQCSCVFKGQAFSWWFCCGPHCFWYFPRLVPACVLMLWHGADILLCTERDNNSAVLKYNGLPLSTTRAMGNFALLLSCMYEQNMEANWVEMSSVTSAETD